MSKKKKGMQLPVDIAKVVWEMYADIVLGNFANELDDAIAKLHISHPIVKGYVRDSKRIPEMLTPIIKRMREYNFDFNRES